MRTTVGSGAEPATGASFVVRRRTPVWCAGQRIGNVVDAVVDPGTRAISHVTVAPAGRPSMARLIDAACLDPHHPSASLRLQGVRWGSTPRVRPGQFLRERLDLPISAPWPLELHSAWVHPWYEDEAALARVAVGSAMPTAVAIDMPRGTCVVSRYGRVIGRIDGFLVAGQQRLGAVIVRSIVPGLRRDVVVPFGMLEPITPDVARVVVDLVTLDHMPFTDVVRRRPADRVVRSMRDRMYEPESSLSVGRPTQ